MAVIHPSPRKKKQMAESPTPNLTLSGNHAKLLPKRHEPRQLPDHLIRAPMDSTFSPKRSKSTAGSPSGRKSLGKGGRRSREMSRKAENEGKRVKRAEENKKLLFQEIKKLLDSKSDDEQLLPPQILCNVGQVKQAIKDKRLFRFVYSQMTNQFQIEQRLSKAEFMGFVKVLLKEMNENDIGDLFLLFCRRLDPHSSKKLNFEFLIQIRKTSTASKMLLQRQRSSLRTPSQSHPARLSSRT